MKDCPVSAVVGPDDVTAAVAAIDVAAKAEVSEAFLEGGVDLLAASAMAWIFSRYCFVSAIMAEVGSMMLYMPRDREATYSLLSCDSLAMG
jgi:hypothetical protein